MARIGVDRHYREAPEPRGGVSGGIVAGLSALRLRGRAALAVQPAGAGSDRGKAWKGPRVSGCVPHATLKLAPTGRRSYSGYFVCIVGEPGCHL